MVHHGRHSCVAKQLQSDSATIETTFRENPDLCPGEAASKAAVNALKTVKAWEDVIDITDSFMNTTKVRNVKQVRKEMHSSGFNIQL